MKLVTLHNHFDQEHLDAVVAKMKVLGAPTIRCFDLGFDGLIQAIEGTHRIRACEILGLQPVLEFVGPNAAIANFGVSGGFTLNNSLQLVESGNCRIQVPLSGEM